MTSKHNALPVQFLYSLLTCLCLISWGCDDSDGFRTIEPGSTILETVREQDNLSQFNQALERSSLANTLQNKNVSFTLFAPSDQAFNAFLASQGYSTIAAVPIEELNSLLEYHIALGLKQSADLDSAMLVNTLSGKDIFIYRMSGSSNITLNSEATIAEADLEGSNGVVHIIDQVLMPPAQSLSQLISSRAAGENPEFSFLQAAVARAELYTVLNSDHPFTLLAPTDAAFMAAGYEHIDSIQSEDPAVLRSILLYHLLPGYRYSFMLPNGDVATQQGKKVTFNTTANTVKGLGNEEAASLISNQGDVLTTNGILHVIDRVLLPQPQ